MFVCVLTFSIYLSTKIQKGFIFRVRDLVGMIRVRVGSWLMFWFFVIMSMKVPAKIEMH